MIFLPKYHKSREKLLLIQIWGFKNILFYGNLLGCRKTASLETCWQIEFYDALVDSSEENRTTVGAPGDSAELAGVPVGRGKAFHFQAELGPVGVPPSTAPQGACTLRSSVPVRVLFLTLLLSSRIYPLCELSKATYNKRSLLTAEATAVFAFLSSWQGVRSKAGLSWARRGEGSPQVRAINGGVIEWKERKTEINIRLEPSVSFSCFSTLWRASENTL